MTLSQIQNSVRLKGLDIYGAFHPDADDMCQAATLFLLGPARDFWAVFSNSAIYQDGLPDPIDRWSTKTLTGLAGELSATAIFPFGGPPYAPFLSWARISNRAWNSPVGMLVHDQTGLMVSYRGALAFQERIDLPPEASQSPCNTCTVKPCLTACPVDALTPNGYDVPKCHAYMDTDAGNTCLTQGCLVRRACPASIGANRTTEQSALHMRAFRGPNS